MRNALKLLQLVSKTIPPKEGQKHALVLEGGCLVLSLSTPNGWVPGKFTEEDLDMAPEFLAQEIIVAFARHSAP